MWDQTPIGKSPDIEVDLLCVSDGNVIVGECKTRSKEFSQNDINKMKEIAEKIDAKEIVFCSLDYEIDERAYKRIVKLQNSLSDKIDVQIMWLSTLFLQAKGAKSVHLPSCNHFSRINRNKAHKYYNYYEFMHETNGLCKSCYSSSKKMSEEWKYWPY